MSDSNPPIESGNIDPHHNRFNQQPKLVFEDRGGRWRKLILCKWVCPDGGGGHPHNICLITANPDYLGPLGDPNGNHAGWLSFTNAGVAYMEALGVTFPVAPDGWQTCPPNGGGFREFGNTTGPGTAYNIGYYFGTPEKALEWLIKLFGELRRPVYKCTYTDAWLSNLSRILDAKKVAPCP